ncbi:MAG: AmmeMemoRadiSam system protein B [Planctomycetota bacterium]
MIRPAAVAGSFYPGTDAACRAAIDECLAANPSPFRESGFDVVAGIVPHAGWVFSGATAARTLLAIGEPEPACFVLFGAVHRHGVPRPAVAPEDAWRTPLGDVRVDGGLRDLLREALAGDLDVSAEAHAEEHSLEVQVPFLAHLFPDATILPVAVPPTPAAAVLGEAVGEVCAGVEGRIVVLGSTDLTHYGPRFYGFTPRGTGPEAHRWAKDENDRAFLARLLAFDAGGALRVSSEQRSACGGGAAAATVAAARALGADRATLLAHTTSHEVQPDPGSAKDFVGYASLVFQKTSV